jgi:dihydrofolate reductase
MRRVIASAMVSLDGVMQAPGGPEEDPTGGFEFGGWVEPHWDEVGGEAMARTFSQPFDLLLGRRTYDIFAAHWPYAQTDPSGEGYDEGMAFIANAFDRATKHVASRSKPKLGWKNSEWLGADAAAKVRELKKGDGPVLLTQGSTVLLHTLLATGLVDELRILVFPVVLGKGKRLFEDGSKPNAFKLTHSVTTPKGVVISNYERAGEVKTGSFASDQPSEAELERRRTLLREEGQ